jgi:hypothetical protein
MFFEASLRIPDARTGPTTIHQTPKDLVVFPSHFAQLYRSMSPPQIHRVMDKLEFSQKTALVEQIRSYFVVASI